MQSRLISLLLVAALLPLPPGALAQSQITPQLSSNPRPRVVLGDRIVAVINDEVITRRELDERVQVVKRDLNRRGVPIPGADVLDAQVLELSLIHI